MRAAPVPLRRLTWPFWTARPDSRTLLAAIDTPAGIGLPPVPDFTPPPVPPALYFETQRPAGRLPDWARGVVSSESRRTDQRR